MAGREIRDALTIGVEIQDYISSVELLVRGGPGVVLVIVVNVELSMLSNRELASGFNNDAAPLLRLAVVVGLDVGIRYRILISRSTGNRFRYCQLSSPRLKLSSPRVAGTNEVKIRFILPAFFGDACHPSHPVDGDTSASFEVKAGHFRS